MSCMASLERVCEMKKVVDKSLIPEYALVFGTANGFSRLKSLEIAIENLSRNVAGQTRSIGNLLMQYESMVRYMLHDVFLSLAYLLSAMF